MSFVSRYLTETEVTDQSYQLYSKSVAKLKPKLHLIYKGFSAFLHTCGKCSVKYHGCSWHS